MSPQAGAAGLATDWRCHHHPANARGLHSFGPIFGLIINRFPVLQSSESLAFDHGMMNKNVLSALFGGDETKPLLVVKPLDLAGGHTATPFETCKDAVRVPFLRRHPKMVRRALPERISVPRCQGILRTP